MKRIRRHITLSRSIDLAALLGMFLWGGWRSAGFFLLGMGAANLLLRLFAPRLRERARRKLREKSLSATISRTQEGMHHVLKCSACGPLAAHNTLHIATSLPSFYGKPKATVAEIERAIDVYYFKRTVLHALEHERVADAFR